MELHVGPHTYRIELVDGYIEHDSQRCLGLCDNEQQVIYIADVGSESQQFQVLCHEYIEAWLYHFGPPPPPGLSPDLPPDLYTGLPEATKERLCDLCGLAMTQFYADLIGCMPHLTARPPRPGPARRLETADAANPSRRWVVEVFDPVRPGPPAPVPIAEHAATPASRAEPNRA